MNEIDYLLLSLGAGLVLWLMFFRLRALRIKAELQQIFDQLEPAVLINEDYSIRRSNLSFAESVGKDWESIIGKRCYEVFENRNTPCVGCRFDRALVNGQSQLLNHYKWDGRNREIIYDIAFHPVDDGKGKRCILEIKQDVTDLQHTRTELLAKNRALVAAQVAIQEHLNQTQEDMDMAREIQRGLLPLSLPKVPELDFWAIYNPIESVGGDLYDVMMLDNFHVGIFMGDVSGHGLPAAFVGALAKMSLGVHAKSEWSPAALLEIMNRDLMAQLHTGHYLTAFYGILDLRTNILRFSRASHPGPILVKEDGSSQHLDTKGLFVGIIEKPGYGEKEIQLHKGDKIFIFTDGCFDVVSSSGERLSFKDFSAMVVRHSGLPKEEVFSAVNSDIADFRASTEGAEDDITFLVAEIVRNSRQERYRYLSHFLHTDCILRFRFCRRKEVETILDSVVERLEKEEYGERCIFNICTSVEEILLNSLEYGHGWNEDLKAAVAWSVNTERFCLSVTDKGAGFEAPQEGLTGLRRKKERGYGLFLAKTYMDGLYFDNGGRTVTLVKQRD